MKFGNLTHWDSGKETIDEWLERENRETARVENPTCPYCGHIHQEWWEFTGLARDYEVEDYKIDCDHCGEKFLCDKETRVRFETRKLDSEEKYK